MLPLYWSVLISRIMYIKHKCLNKCFIRVIRVCTSKVAATKINLNGNHIGIMCMQLNKAEHNLYNYSYNACGDELSIILSDSNFCNYIGKMTCNKNHTNNRDACVIIGKTNETWLAVSHCFYSQSMKMLKQDEAVDKVMKT